MDTANAACYGADGVIQGASFGQKAAPLLAVPSQSSTVWLVRPPPRVERALGNPSSVGLSRDARVTLAGARYVTPHPMAATSSIIRRGLVMSSFSLGQLSVSPLADAALAANGLSADTFFARHAAGDWGSAEAFDQRGNAFALAQGVTRFLIQSAFPLPDGELLLVMTTPDRTQTAMLLDREFEDTEVSAAEAYARWAAYYDREVNPLIAIETPYVERMVADLRIDTALDAATGTGRHGLWLARQGIHVTGIDQSPEMLAVARARAAQSELAVDLHLGSLDAPLPFADAQFDLVICALALCHVQNLRGAICEFARVLRPGGAVIISDFHPYCVGEGWRAALFGPGRAYVVRYAGHSRDDYLSALEAAGLEVRQAVDATMGEAPHGTMLDEERVGGRDIPYCLVLLAVKPA
jgi:SAM-dependent methyltransferase